MKGGREGGREGGMKGRRKRWRDGGRDGWREGGREGGRTGVMEGNDGGTNRRIPYIQRLHRRLSVSQHSGTDCSGSTVCNQRLKSCKGK